MIKINMIKIDTEKTEKSINNFVIILTYHIVLYF